MQSIFGCYDVQSRQTCFKFRLGKGSNCQTAATRKNGGGMCWATAARTTATRRLRQVVQSWANATQPAASTGRWRCAATLESSRAMTRKRIIPTSCSQELRTAARARAPLAVRAVGRVLLAAPRAAGRGVPL